MVSKELEMKIKRKIKPMTNARVSKNWIAHRSFSASWLDGYGRGICFGRSGASYPFGRNQLSR